MKCFVYVSKEAIVFDKQSLTELAESSAKRNAEAGITGYLYYENGYFTQYIEGSSEALDGLVGALNRESRHSIVASYDGTVETRRFVNWNMRQLQKSELVEIKLEHVLTDYVQFVGGGTAVIELDPQPLWRMVEKLALFQNRMSEGNAQ